MACLSEIARNDVLTEKEPRTLSMKCRNQLQFQLLQKHSSIKLNPKIFQSCKKAIQKNCKIGEGNVLECLKSLNHNMMSPKCRMAVFEEQQEEVLIDGVDHELLIGKNCYNFTKNDTNNFTKILLQITSHAWVALTPHVGELFRSHTRTLGLSCSRR